MSNIQGLNYELINNIDFAELASEYGIDFENNKALCPFHDEKTPSFHNYGKYGYCFGCGKRVDPIELVSFYKKVSRKRAAQSLAKRYNIEAVNEKASEKYRKTKIAKRLLGRFATIANKELKKHKEAILYLKARGLAKVDVDKYIIGYIPEDKADLLSITKNSHEKSIAEEIGLIKDDKIVFSNRIILPVWNSGEITYLTSRSIDSKKYKYLHLKNSELIMKSIAFSEYLINEYCIVTEGIFEAIAFHKAGFPSCALLGINPGENCRKVLKNSNTKLYFCFDNDEAGVEASYKLAKECHGYILDLNSEYDSDELLLKLGPSKFKRAVNKAISNSKYYIDKVIIDENYSEALRIVSSVKTDEELDIGINQIHKKYKKEGITKSTIRKSIAEKRNDQKKMNIEDNGAKEIDNKTYSTYFDGLIDIVLHNREIKYLVKDNEKLIIKNNYESDEITIYPPPKKSIPPKLLLPRSENVLKYYDSDSDSKLFDDLIEHHKSISELPGDDYYILLAAWDFHTYLLEKFNYSPILWLYAMPGRGKSRTGKGCIYVAYRGLHVESLREAHLIRWSNDLKASLLLDIANITKKAMRENSEDILLQRFEKGATVSRVMHPEQGALKDMIYYEIFGATITSTNEPLDEIFSTRAIQIVMPESNRKFEEDLSPEKYLDLKERLIAFRARNINKQLPNRDKPTKGRLGDITKPLLQIIALVKPDLEEKFLNLVNHIKKERNTEEKQSLEVLIFQTIISLEDKVKKGLLSIALITKHYNSTLDKKFVIENRNVGHITSKLGFKKKHLEDGAYLIWNDSLIHNLKVRFDIRNQKVRKIINQKKKSRRSK